MIVTVVPTGPLVGVKSVMVGGILVGTTKGIALVPVPPGFVTVMGPVVAVKGTKTVMDVSETMVKPVAGTPLKATAVAVVKPVPAIVTRVSEGGPLRGLNMLIVGGASEFFTVSAASGSKIPVLATPAVVDGFETVSAASGSSAPKTGVPPVVNGFETVKAASGSSVPKTGVPPVVNGFDTVKAASGNSIPTVGIPPVVNGLDTVSAASGSKVPTLGKPTVVNGFRTVSPAVESSVP